MEHQNEEIKKEKKIRKPMSPKTKKILLITGISVASLIAVFCIAIVIVCNVVFSSSNLKPIVSENLSKSISCQADFSDVDLTFFSTFPRFGVKIDGLKLTNPMENAQSSTLASIGTIKGTIDISDYLFDDKIVLDKINIENGEINLFVDEDGKTNYNIFKDNNQDKNFAVEDIRKIIVNNISLSYINEMLGYNTKIENLCSNIKGNFNENDKKIEGNLSIKNLLGKNLYDETTFANFNDITIDVNGLFNTDSFDGTINLSIPNSTLSFADEKIIENDSIKFNIPAKFNFDLTNFDFKKASFKISDYQINLNGTSNAKSKNYDDFSLDMEVSTNAIDVPRTIKKIETYSGMSLLDDSFDINGLLSLNGTIKGNYNNKSFPSVTATANYNKGRISLQDVPFPIEDINISVSTAIDWDNYDIIIKDADLNNLSAKFGPLFGNLSCNIDDILPFNKSKIDANLSLLIDLHEIKDVLTKDQINLLLKDLNLIPYNDNSSSDIDLNGNVKYTLSGKINCKNIFDKFGAKDDIYSLYDLENSINNIVDYISKESRQRDLYGQLDLISEIVNIISQNCDISTSLSLNKAKLAFRDIANVNINGIYKLDIPFNENGKDYICHSSFNNGNCNLFVKDACNISLKDIKANATIKNFLNNHDLSSESTFGLTNLNVHLDKKLFKGEEVNININNPEFYTSLDVKDILRYININPYSMSFDNLLQYLPNFIIKYNFGSIDANVGSDINLKSNSIIFEANKNEQLSYIPKVAMSFNNMNLKTPICDPININRFSLNLQKNLDLNECKITFGQDDYNLSGKIYDLISYISNQNNGPIKGAFNFKSNNFNLDKILSMLEMNFNKSQYYGSNPRYIDLNVNTSINNAKLNNSNKNINGTLNIQDQIISFKNNYGEYFVLEPAY